MAKRIFDRLKAEHGFDFGCTTVKDYVFKRCVAMNEAIVPLHHPRDCSHPITMRRSTLVKRRL